MLRRNVANNVVHQTFSSSSSSSTTATSITATAGASSSSSSSDSGSIISNKTQAPSTSNKNGGGNNISSNKTTTTMMQRRIGGSAVGAGKLPSSVKNNINNNNTNHKISIMNKSKKVDTKSSSSSSSGLLSLVFIILLIFIIIVTYTFPTKVHEVEQRAVQEAESMAHKAYMAEQELQKEMDEWFHPNNVDKRQNVPIPQEQHPHFVDSSTSTDTDADTRTGSSSNSNMNNVATQRMLQQDSKWVDGEKKLKKKLKVLVERQKRGLDIGVPVLTRYLGEDIPAWPNAELNGMDVDTWNAKVKSRYEEMRIEEEQWKKMINEYVEHEDQNRG